MRLTLDGSFVLILELALYVLLSPSQMTSSSSSSPGGCASMDLVSSRDESLSGGGVVGGASAAVGSALGGCPDVDGWSPSTSRRMGQSAAKQDHELAPCWRCAKHNGGRASVGAWGAGVALC